MSRRGLTLIELVLVLVIMAAIGALVVPLVGRPVSISTPAGERTTEHIVTEETMRQIRDVIVGNENQAGLWSDIAHNPQYFPREVAELYLDSHRAAFDPALPDGGMPLFDKHTKIGWRGPYLTQAPGRTTREPGDQAMAVHDHGGPLHPLHPYSATIFAGGTPTAIDGWGNPIRIHVAFNDPTPCDRSDDVLTREEVRYARLVSDGPDGIPQTPPMNYPEDFFYDNECYPERSFRSEGDYNQVPSATGDRASFLTREECGDDIVMFVFIPDALAPSANEL